MKFEVGDWVTCDISFIGARIIESIEPLGGIVLAGENFLWAPEYVKANFSLLFRPKKKRKLTRAQAEEWMENPNLLVRVYANSKNDWIVEDFSSRELGQGSSFLKAVIKARKTLGVK